MASGGVGRESPTLPQNWEKGRYIGQGTFGEVYHVRDKDNPMEKRFVVKEIRCYSKPYLDREIQLVKVMTQIEHLKSIQHYSLVSVVDVCTDGNVLSLFSPFMPKGTLADYIEEKGPIPESLASTFTHQLLEGVSYLHDRRIVHQNIKCSNLLLMLGFYIKLADYGVSDTLESLCHKQTVMDGSFNWMAPEVLCGDGQEQTRTSADIWSVGCVVIEMITGKPPFPDQRMNEVIVKHYLKVSPEYTLPQGSSDSLKQFVEQALQVDPQKRPTASNLIEHDFPQGRRNPLPKNWKKGRQIGRGGFGTVYLLRDPERPNDKLFAVKEMQSMPDKEKKMFNREVDTLKRIKHDRIISLVGTIEEGQTVSIILPYMPEGSLDRYIQSNGPIEEEEALELLQQVVEGVSYLHSRKIIHRDIKGANILLVTKAKVKLADFGISKAVETSYGTNTKETGTTRFTAPEVLNGIHYGLSADIWSLGCLFIEMVTGKPPYHGMEQPAAMLKIIQGVRPECQVWNDLDDDTRDMLDSMFKMNPHDRPTADSLLETIGEILWLAAALIRRRREIERRRLTAARAAARAADRAFAHLDRAAAWEKENERAAARATAWEKENERAAAEIERTAAYLGYLGDLKLLQKK